VELGQGARGRGAEEWTRGSSSAGRIRRPGIAAPLERVRKKISRTHAHDTLIEQLGGALRVCCQKHGSKRIIPTALRSNFRMHGDRRESPPPASVLRCGLLARLVAHFAKRETRTSEEFLRANFRNEGGDRTRFRKYFHGRERVQIRSRFLADFREYASGNATRIFLVPEVGKT